MKRSILGAAGLAALIASAPAQYAVTTIAFGSTMIAAQLAQAQSEHMATQYVDARGKASPMPVLLTRKIMRTMNSGETVEVRATDPHSVKNIEEYCKEMGNKILIMKEEGGVYIFLIEKF